MADILTTITVPGREFPYINPYGEPVQWQTPIPRSEIVFNVVNSAITLSGSGDTQRVLINCFLPTTYAYVLVSAGFVIEGALASQWSDNAYVNIADGTSNGTLTWKKYLQAPSLLASASVGQGLRAYRVDPGLSKIIIPLVDAGKLEMISQDLNLNEAAINCSVFCRFLVFDRNQAQHWSVNTPIPTR